MISGRLRQEGRANMLKLGGSGGLVGLEGAVSRAGTILSLARLRRSRSRSRTARVFASKPIDRESPRAGRDVARDTGRGPKRRHSRYTAEQRLCPKRSASFLRPPFSGTPTGGPRIPVLLPSSPPVARCGREARSRSAVAVSGPPPNHVRAASEATAWA